jgi:hypothetical protein
MLRRRNGEVLLKCRVRYFFSNDFAHTYANHIKEFMMDTNSTATTIPCEPRLPTAKVDGGFRVKVEGGLSLPAVKVGGGFRLPTASAGSV